MDNRRNILRRLGRTWEYPEDRAFLFEWLAGLIPVCEDCGRTIPTHHGETICQSCSDWRDVEARNRHYDIVLVSEEYGFRLWAWYPDPTGMTDIELLRLWRSVPRFNLRTDFHVTLGGTWHQLSDEGWWDIRDEFERRGPLRIAHVHEDKDSHLFIHYPDWIQHPNGSRGGSCIALHQAHPKRRS